jgi:hypothetical protein
MNGERADPTKRTAFYRASQHKAGWLIVVQGQITFHDFICDRYGVISEQTCVNSVIWMGCGIPQIKSVVMTGSGKGDQSWHENLNHDKVGTGDTDL